MLQIHEHMTPQELRSVFHVEHHSHVPEYHLVQLTHHLSRRHIGSSHPTNSHNQSQGKIPHEKNSKPYKRPWKNGDNPPSLLNDEMFVKAKNYIKDVDIIGDLNNTVSVQFGVTNSSEISDSESSENGDLLSDLEHIYDDQDVDVHKIDLEAFGKLLNLILKKQEGLVKKEGLKMWKVMTNESEPHGIDYEQMEPVSN